VISDKGKGIDLTWGKYALRDTKGQTTTSRSSAEWGPERCKKIGPTKGKYSRLEKKILRDRSALDPRKKKREINLFEESSEVSGGISIPTS